jgi:hypothetical protein
MKRLISLSIMASFSFILLCAAGVIRQEANVQILDPSRDGAEVRRTYIVRGSASIPSGTHLWVLSRREDFEGIWWPQGEGKVDPTSGEWRVSVTFGNQDDVGWNFDIAAIVVTEQNHIILRDYRTNAMKKNDWRPVELPQIVAPPVLRKVKKVGH